MKENDTLPNLITSFSWLWTGESAHMWCTRLQLVKIRRESTWQVCDITAGEDQERVLNN